MVAQEPTRDIRPTQAPPRPLAAGALVLFVEPGALVEPYLAGSIFLLLGALLVFGCYHLVMGLGKARPPSAPLRQLDGEAPRVTFLLSAYREGDIILDCIRSVLDSDYPSDRLRVVVVVDEDDDGGFDALRGMLDAWGATSSWSLEGDEIVETERVRAILQSGDRAGRGKPRALQNAMRYVPEDGLVGVLDADHILDDDFVSCAVARFREPDVAIVQGRRRPKSGARGWLERWDSLEQHVGQVQALIARDAMDCANFYGSTAIMRTELLHEVGWEDCLAEDTMLHYELRERGFRIVYEAQRGSTEDTVGRLRSFVVQRRRWAAGHTQVLCRKLGVVARRGLRGAQRLETLLHLNYYMAVVVMLSYWLLRATHHWMQAVGPAFMLVAGVAGLGGVAGYVFERLLDRQRRVAWKGAFVAALLTFGLLSLIASYVQPAARPLPIPPWVDALLFLMPVLQMGFAYLNPLVRPRVDVWREHAAYLATLVVFAPFMEVVNAYVALTGVMLGISRQPVAWVKTSRKSRKIPWTPLN